MRRLPGILALVVLAGCALSHERAPTSAARPDAGVAIATDGGSSTVEPVDAGPSELDAGPVEIDAGPAPECPPDCDDGNDCTDDRCEAFRCVHTPVPDRCAFFEQHLIRAVSGAHSVEAVDLDLDGDLDLVCSAHRARLYTWEENLDGAGGEWSQHLIHYGDVARRLITADLDEDGDLDLVGGGGNDDPHPIRFFENTVRDGSAFGVNEIGDRELQDLDVGDFDGDGDLDVVAVSQWDGAEVYLLRNTAEGFVTETIGPDLGSFPQHVELIDLNLDGRLDVLAASFRLLWLEQTADGALVEHDLDFPGATSVHPVDIDGDSDLDLLVASASDEAGWVENLDGRFGDTAVHSIGDFDYPWSAHGADMDGDGDVDALIASRDDDEFVLMLNQGGGRWERLLLGGELNDAFDVIAADVDGDGDLDVVGAATYAGFVWWENLGNL